MSIMFVMLFVLCFMVDKSCSAMSKKTKCLNPPRTAKKVEMNIKECKEEVKNKIVQEAFELIRDQIHSDELHEEEDDLASYYNSPDLPDYDHTLLEEQEQKINRRSFSYHPTLVPQEERRIAGCLLHCVYAKNNAIDKLGWPTLDGLVDFYSEGVSEHGFFMATLRAVNLCLRAASHKYHVNRHHLPERGESCDIAFDVFDCISDQITSYCLDHYHHD